MFLNGIMLFEAIYLNVSKFEERERNMKKVMIPKWTMTWQEHCEFYS